MLCHEHSATSKLPFLDVSQSLQGHVETKTDALIRQICDQKEQKAGKKKMKTVNNGSNLLLPGLRGDSLAKYDRQMGKLFEASDDPAINRLAKTQSMGFCAPCSIQEEVRRRDICSCPTLPMQLIIYFTFSNL